MMWYYSETVPTINEILKFNPKSLVILSHMGRPNGQKIAKLSLKPIVPQL
jgi:phosphoglycerate kinase